MLNDLLGWTLIAVTTAVAEDEDGHEWPTIQTLMFARAGGGCRTISVSASDVGGTLPYLEFEELK